MTTAARQTPTRSTSPGFLASEIETDHIASLLALGVERFRELSAESNRATIDEAVARAGTRAVTQLRAVHAGDTP